MQHYIYDANGERVLKANSDYETTYQNGTLLNPPDTVSINGYTSYPSAFMVINSDGIYSKHYYAGAQRIVSRLGDQSAEIFNNGEYCQTCKQESNKDFDPKKLQQAQKADLQMYADQLKKGTILYKDYKELPLAEQENALQENGSDERPIFGDPIIDVPKIYFYHPDHLGTSTALTDYFGKAYQFFLNLPFGETMAQQLGSNYYNSPYKFNGKELDEETGLYYYGARYYSPRESIWLSVDPLAEKYSGFNPYNYCLGNPINLVDPSGMSAEKPGDIYSKSGKHLKNDGMDDHKVYVVNDNKINADQKWNANDQVEIKGLTNEQLLQTAASTNNEWENSFEGRGAIANTIINRMEKMNLTFDETMGSLAGSSVGSSHEGRMKSKWFAGYQDFINAGNSGRNSNSVFKSCLSATLDAYNGGFDYSNGSIGWQGTDFFSSQVRSNGKQWPAYLEYKAKGFKWDSNVLNGNGKYKLPNNLNSINQKSCN